MSDRYLLRALRQGVPERAPAGDDDRGLVVAAAGVLVLRGPGGPVGGQGVLVPVVRRAAGFLRSHRHRHGDDERQQAVVSGPLGVQAPGFGGTPRPAGLLVEKKRWRGCVNDASNE